MSRIKGIRSSAALMVAVVALVAALGGGAVAGVTISKLNKKEKKQVKRISRKQARKAVSGIPAGPKGEQGPIGPKGDAGENATNLLAYVFDDGAFSAAKLQYGQGAASVSDPSDNNNALNPYVVTFDRDLSDCVAHPTAGKGDPSGGPGGLTPTAMVGAVSGSTVAVWAKESVDTSFMLSVFCSNPVRGG